jgi:hypothetical protein
VTTCPFDGQLAIQVTETRGDHSRQRGTGSTHSARGAFLFVTAPAFVRDILGLRNGLPNHADIDSETSRAIASRCSVSSPSGV